jgi:NADPH:quinone reductase-like Zn-dependent oxidoreductase
MGMKAIVCRQYGPPEVLQIQEVEKPAPRNNEVLIQVYATSVHRGDSRMRGLNIPGPGWQKILARLFLGIRRPRNDILGMELAGKVAAAGKDVSRFKPGDDVFASTVWSGFGAYAEYKCMPENGVIARKPSNLSYTEAAVIPSGGITALGIVKMAKLQPGQKALIYGASGSVGAFAVQLAKAFGAEVTGVCSTANLELVGSLGADNVIDYTKEDFTENVETYDVVFDAVDKVPPGQAKKAVKLDGIYLNVHTSSDKVKKTEAPSLLVELKALIEAEKLQAVIDRTYSFEDIIEAHRYVDKGHKRGNIAVTILHDVST